MSRVVNAPTYLHQTPTTHGVWGRNARFIGLSKNTGKGGMMERLDPIEEALESLQRKGLIEPDGFGSWQITDKAYVVALAVYDPEEHKN